MRIARYCLHGVRQARHSARAWRYFTGGWTWNPNHRTTHNRRSQSRRAIDCHVTISSRACPRRSVPRFWLVSDTRYSGRNIVAVVRLRRKEALKKGAVSAALFLHLRRTWAECVSRVAQSATARLLGSAEATQNTCRTKIDRVAHDQLDIGLTVRQQTAATAHLPCVQYRLKPRCSAPGELCQGLFKV